MAKHKTWTLEYYRKAEMDMLRLNFVDSDSRIKVRPMFTLNEIKWIIYLHEGETPADDMIELGRGRTLRDAIDNAMPAYASHTGKIPINIATYPLSESGKSA